MKQLKGGLPDGGGSGTWGCWITKYMGPNHTNPQNVLVLFEGNTCSNALTSANNYCVNLIVTPGTGVYNCGYNCGCGIAS
jgi:hypothetical protein